MKHKLIWAPQAGPQKALIDCPLEEIFFGGARGGGKTDGVLGKWAIKEALYGDNFNAIMFRRTTVSADDAIERSKQIYGPLGGKFNNTDKIWRMPHGGRVCFKYLERVQDADEYQGKNVSDAWVEEIGQYPSSAPIDRLFGILRSAAGVPIQLIGTGNPGGAGQGWIRERYQLHPFPRKPKILSRPLSNGESHRFAVIPSRLQDNQILLAGDPGYRNRLHLVGGEAIVRAWLEGDWSAIEGAFFDGWTERLVLRPFTIPSHWTRFRAFDWGYAAPFCVQWWAVASEDLNTPDGAFIPKGALLCYREWYGKSAPNVGLRLESEEIALGILQREAKEEEISYSVADPSIFASNGGPSLAERMANKDVIWRPADNQRIAQRGHMGGWDQMRYRIKNRLFLIFSTCDDLIRTLPMMQHDLNRPEDMDSEGEDHAVDTARYACMSRPWTAEAPAEDKPIEIAAPTFNELLERNKRKRLSDD